MMLSNLIRIGQGQLINANAITFVDFEPDDEAPLMRVHFIGGEGDESLVLAGSKAQTLWEYLSEEKGL